MTTVLSLMAHMTGIFTDNIEAPSSCQIFQGTLMRYSQQPEEFTTPQFEQDKKTLQMVQEYKDLLFILTHDDFNYTNLENIKIYLCK